MKVLLVWAYCLGCNSSTLSVTKFDTMAECNAARDAIMKYTEESGFGGMRLSIDGESAPQCIPYVVNDGEGK